MILMNVRRLKFEVAGVEEWDKQLLDTLNEIKLWKTITPLE